MKTIKEVVKNDLKALLLNGPVSLIDAYKIIASKNANLGVMEFSEFRAYIKDFAIDKNIIYGSTQMTLF